MAQSSKTVTITSLAYGGDAVGHIDSKVIFVPHAVPGDELRVKITKDKASFMHGEIEEIISPSPHRVEPFCPLALRCGGCQWQAVDYTEQLKWKQTIVKESLRRISDIGSVEVEPCIPSTSDRGYRTVARYPVQVKSKGIELGYYERKSHTITPLTNCPVAADKVNELTSYLLDLFAEITPELDITEITLEASINMPSAIVGITTKKMHDLSGAVEIMLSDIPWLDGVVHHNGHSNKKNFYGKKERFESVGDKSFRISESSFFQINVGQTEKLVNVVKEMLEIGEKDVVVDGFGGVGLFSLTAAPKDTVIHLYDSSRSAVKDSTRNAKNMGFTKFKAYKADTAGALELIGHADILILDPPRLGLGPETVKTACDFGARTIVYISCNPTTLARDLKSFISDGYKVERVVPVDMFPHTYHIETAVKLVKKGV
ncbi:23S rRNA (uracil(1939)-C(5))-methyltransferase RlmD [Candidatus Latescibacterota bacterium]